MCICPVLRSIDHNNLTVVIPHDAIASVEDGLHKVVYVWLWVRELSRLWFLGEEPKADGELRAERCLVPHHPAKLTVEILSPP